MMQRHDIRVIGDFVEQHGLSEQTLGELRTQYCGRHFTWCMEDDMNGERPYSERCGFNVYLVDSRDHCARVTSDEEAASGLIFAERLDDD